MFTSLNQSAAEKMLQTLRVAGNPFRNHFARNPDDETCAKYHVPELYSRERNILLGIVDRHRYANGQPSEVVPILGNKGAGKTHLLHSIKHGREGTWQLLVTPGTFHRDTDFLEYLFFQLIETLLGGARQGNARPLDFVGENLIRLKLIAALGKMGQKERQSLFPRGPFLGWLKMFGYSTSQSRERTEWLLEQLTRLGNLPYNQGALRKLCEQSGLGADAVVRILENHSERTEGKSPSALMRRALVCGFAKAVLQGNENDLAEFLTNGFAELNIQIRPGRQDLVLALLKVLMEMFRTLCIPVVVAFDQLEDLLLARRNDETHRTAEAFFAGIVHAMHQVEGLTFLIFAERGLWNRFLPSIDGYIQDRLNQPLHVPGHGTIHALRLEAPPVELVQRMVEARLRAIHASLIDARELSPIYPYTMEQVGRIARTEPTLRDMIQQFRRLFDLTVFGAECSDSYETIHKVETLLSRTLAKESRQSPEEAEVETDLKGQEVSNLEGSESETAGDIAEEANLAVDPVTGYSDPASPGPLVQSQLGSYLGLMGGETLPSHADLWDQEVRTARRRLEPEGAVTGATRELQAGLGHFLRLAMDHGVKVGPWRLQHVVDEWNFGEHPTYGVLSIAHWTCRGGNPWRVGIGLFLGRGQGKLKDLTTKLSVFDIEPSVLDHLILLRPEDDPTLAGKSKQLWQDMEQKGRHCRLELVGLEEFSALFATPRFVSGLFESLPSGQIVPNQADLIQDRCESLLKQLCMPVQGG
ncbi:MAG: hypothetical protein EXS11_05190 [Gemmataceae bacterium]|nr:hypothetical protein [Gemmataceae bacterium]